MELEKSPPEATPAPRRRARKEPNLVLKIFLAGLIGVLSGQTFSSCKIISNSIRLSKENANLRARAALIDAAPLMPDGGNIVVVFNEERFFRFPSNSTWWVQRGTTNRPNDSPDHREKITL